MYYKPQAYLCNALDQIQMKDIFLIYPEYEFCPYSEFMLGFFGIAIQP
jgi:hypothetical protein